MPDPISTLPVTITNASPPVPGHRTTEGLAALVAVALPVMGAALGYVTSWLHVAVLGIIAVVACVYIIGRSLTKRPSGPIVALLVALSLLAGTARADEPAPPVRAPVTLVASAPAAPEACPVPTQTQQAAQIIAATVAGLQAAQQNLGPALPESFWQSSGGKTLTIFLSVGIAVATTAGTVVGSLQAAGVIGAK